MLWRKASLLMRLKSFWHASSKGDTQEALVKFMQKQENLGNLAETDANVQRPICLQKLYWKYNPLLPSPQPTGQMWNRRLN